MSFSSSYETYYKLVTPSKPAIHHSQLYQLCLIQVSSPAALQSLPQVILSHLFLVLIQGISSGPTKALFPGLSSSCANYLIYPPSNPFNLFPPSSLTGLLSPPPAQRLHQLLATHISPFSEVQLHHRLNATLFV